MLLLLRAWLMEMQNDLIDTNAPVNGESNKIGSADEKVNAPTAHANADDGYESDF